MSTLTADEIVYAPYKGEEEIKEIMDLIVQDLSEPYSIYTYRYFLNTWPHLCITARREGQLVGAVVGKLDIHRTTHMMRGYVAMLAVSKECRKRRIGTSLVERVILEMAQRECEEVVLEAEVSNTGALALYQRLGFVRDKRLVCYYLNGEDAFRLKLWLR